MILGQSKNILDGPSPEVNMAAGEFLEHMVTVAWAAWVPNCSD